MNCQNCETDRYESSMIAEADGADKLRNAAMRGAICYHTALKRGENRELGSHFVRGSVSGYSVFAAQPELVGATEGRAAGMHSPAVEVGLDGDASA